MKNETFNGTLGIQDLPNSHDLFRTLRIRQKADAKEKLPFDVSDKTQQSDAEDDGVANRKISLITAGSTHLCNIA